MTQGDAKVAFNHTETVHCFVQLPEGAPPVPVLNGDPTVSIVYSVYPRECQVDITREMKGKWFVGAIRFSGPILTAGEPTEGMDIILGPFREWPPASVEQLPEGIPGWMTDLAGSWLRKVRTEVMFTEITGEVPDSDRINNPGEER